MMCQNCGNFQANIKYTQMKNGVVKEIKLCDNCAMSLGINSAILSKAINSSNVITELLEGYSSNILNREIFPYNREALDYEYMYKNDLFDFEKEYKALKNELISFFSENEGGNSKAYTINIKNREIQNKNTEEKRGESNEERIKKLQSKMDLAVEEERYEDAARFRDEINKLKGKE